MNQDQKKTTDPPPESQASSPDSLQRSQAKVSVSSIHSIDIADWQQFWISFQRAAIMKDTASILGLTNFPIILSSEMSNPVELINFGLDDIFGFGTEEEPIDADGFPISISNPNNVPFPELKAIRYTNYNDKDYFFAKVNGFYKLVAINAPG